ncbi:MAG TPA: hypothetical protein VFG39_05580 [Balneolaceae bacterium]|nr:hypothetical protein [Balneolaceae bacterium]
MVHRELNSKNYRRICIINWMLAVPFFIIFSWPYLYLSHFAGIEKFMAYTGCILFSAPFLITILHGHVTMALGEAHRHHYYNWLNEHPLTYGLLFHPVVTGTRFRLILLAASFLVFVAGYLLS